MRRGRRPDQLRDIRIQRRFTTGPPGSVLIQAGRTMVLCTATIEDGVPPFLMNTNKGWVSAEYSMLPGSTAERKAREGRKGPVDGRTLEIGRLLGRSLRGACNLGRITGRTVWVDCDVLQADGGTRTLAISGGMLALHDALVEAERRGWVRGGALGPRVAAVSVGWIEDEPRLDLDYEEDARADVDMNVVMNDRGELLEVQSSAEGAPFSRARLGQLLDLAESGIRQVLDLQARALADG